MGVASVGALGPATALATLTDTSTDGRLSLRLRWLGSLRCGVGVAAGLAALYPLLDAAQVARRLHRDDRATAASPPSLDGVGALATRGALGGLLGRYGGGTSRSSGGDGDGGGSSSSVGGGGGTGFVSAEPLRGEGSEGLVVRLCGERAVAELMALQAAHGGRDGHETQEGRLLTSGRATLLPVVLSPPPARPPPRFPSTRSAAGAAVADESPPFWRVGGRGGGVGSTMDAAAAGAAAAGLILDAQCRAEALLPYRYFTAGQTSEADGGAGAEGAGSARAVAGTVALPVVPPEARPVVAWSGSGPRERILVVEADATSAAFRHDDSRDDGSGDGSRGGPQPHPRHERRRSLSVGGSSADAFSGDVPSTRWNHYTGVGQGWDLGLRGAVAALASARDHVACQARGGSDGSDGSSGSGGSSGSDGWLLDGGCVLVHVRRVLLADSRWAASKRGSSGAGAEGPSVSPPPLGSDVEGGPADADVVVAKDQIVRCALVHWAEGLPTPAAGTEARGTRQCSPGPDVDSVGEAAGAVTIRDSSGEGSGVEGDGAADVPLLRLSLAFIDGVGALVRSIFLRRGPAPSPAPGFEPGPAPSPALGTRLHWRTRQRPALPLTAPRLAPGIGGARTPMLLRAPPPPPRATSCAAS